MNKNWLIRTKNNHILGPVTKDKIKQLISNGSIKGDDEVSCGNGYWIFVRETDLVEKYVFGDIPQDFNPVQESVPVLTQISNHDRRSYPVQEATDGAILPSETDLMYPGEDNSVQSQTNDTSIGIELSGGSLKKRLPETSPGSSVIATENELDRLSSLRDRAVRKTPTPKNTPPVTPTAKPKLNSVPSQKIEKEVSVSSALSGKKLLIITLLFVLFGCVLLYFRGALVQKLIEAASIVTPNAYAQSFESDKKKSGLINLA